MTAVVLGSVVGLTCATGGWAAAGAADSDSYIAVTVNGEPVAVEAALAAAGEDVTTRSYTLCSSSGASQMVTLSGWSVGALLQAAGAAPDQVSSVSVPRITGSGDVVLRPADYDPSASGYPAFGEGPAVIVRRTTGADQTPADDFFRPYRGSSCAADPNADDHVVTPVGSVLSVAIASGTILQVSDAVDHDHPSAGQAVTFTGSVANPPSGEALNYRWQFGDGSVGYGLSISHSYAGAGSYSVLLTVDSGAAAGGAAAPLAVTVGSAPGLAGAGSTPRATARPRTTARTRPGPATTSVSVRPSSSPAALPVTPHPTAARPDLPSPSDGAAPAPAPLVASPLPLVASPAPPAPPSTPSTGELVAGRSISLLAPASASRTDDPRVPALSAALGPDGTAAPSSSHDWAPFAGVGGALLCFVAGVTAELALNRRRVAR